MRLETIMLKKRQLGRFNKKFISKMSKCTTGFYSLFYEVQKIVQLIKKQPFLARIKKNQTTSMLKTNLKYTDWYILNIFGYNFYSYAHKGRTD